MTHLSELKLALYAAGDLGFFAQHLADRHVRQCGACQNAASEFSALRSEAKPFPVSSQAWSRLETDMRANIRLGLAAGECVVRRPARSFVSGRRLAWAGGVLATLMVAGIWMNRPNLLRDSAFRIPAPETVLEASESGIQIRGARRMLRILNSSPRGVSYAVGAQGELRARSLDSSTGNVTITNVYGE